MIAHTGFGFSTFNKPLKSCTTGATRFTMPSTIFDAVFAGMSW